MTNQSNETVMNVMTATLDVPPQERELFEAIGAPVEGSPTAHAIDRRFKALGRLAASVPSLGTTIDDGYIDRMFAHTFGDGVVLEAMWSYDVEARYWYFAGMRIGDVYDIWCDFGESDPGAMGELESPEGLAGSYRYQCKDTVYEIVIR